MKKIPYAQVDVFSAELYKGNPVCVFFDGGDLTTQEMQAIANWTNLSETTFILPSDKADYRLRIFTPDEELPFAGHPTLGSAHAFLEANALTQSSVIQECDYGIINIEVNRDALYFTLPKYTLGAKVDGHMIKESLNTQVSEDCQVIDTGPHWITAHLPSHAALDAISVNQQLLSKVLSENHTTGISVYVLSSEGVNVRSFFTANGVVAEDPVCGSGNAAVAAHIKESQRMMGDVIEYQAQQGKHVGRSGQVFVRIQDKISIGGRCQTLFHGEAKV